LNLLALLTERVALDDLIIVLGGRDSAITRLAATLTGLLDNCVVEGIGDAGLRLRRELSRGKESRSDILRAARAWGGWK
jgi:hypothetical protein